MRRSNPERVSAGPATYWGSRTGPDCSGRPGSGTARAIMWAPRDGRRAQERVLRNACHPPVRSREECERTGGWHPFLQRRSPRKRRSVPPGFVEHSRVGKPATPNERKDLQDERAFPSTSDSEETVNSRGVVGKTGEVPREIARPTPSWRPLCSAVLSPKYEDCPWQGPTPGGTSDAAQRVHHVV